MEKNTKRRSLPSGWACLLGQKRAKLARCAASHFISSVQKFIFQRKLFVHPKHDDGSIERKPIPATPQRVVVGSTLSIIEGAFVPRGTAATTGRAFTGGSTTHGLGRKRSFMYWDSQVPPRFLDLSGRCTRMSRLAAVSARALRLALQRGVLVRLQTRTLVPAFAAEKLPLSAGRLAALASVESGPRATRDAIRFAC